MFNVTLSKPASVNVLVAFNVTSATAVAGQDFSPTSGTLTFTPGQTALPLTVQILGDSVQEGSETFNVTLDHSGQHGRGRRSQCRRNDSG